MAFKKGQSGNPAGRPKGARMLAPALRKRFVTDPKEFQELIDSLVGLAKQGNPKALEVVRSAMDGPEIKQFNITELSNEQILELLAQGDDDGDDDEANSESAV